jgi:site-specific DNA recombinase
LYATGEYSLPQLADELERLGLRSRPSNRWPSTPLGSSVLQRLLRNRYYIGVVVYHKGKADEQVFEGRHEALIDQETFDAVQTLLDEKRVAGERPRARQNYLRGSVYCHESHERLAYALSTGRNGQQYPYFFCVGRVNRSSCTMRTNIRPELIEAAIQRFYVEHPIQLSAKDVHKRTEAIEALAAVSQEALAQVQRVKTELIRKLETRQDKLVDMRFEEKSISASVFKRRQTKLEQELAAAHASLAETAQRLTINIEDLTMALELAEDVAQVYRDADEQTKRAYNQAFFKKLFVIPEWDEEGCCTVVRIASAELTEPYALLLRGHFAEDVVAEAEAITAQAAQDAKKASGSHESSLKPFANDVSYYELLANIEGKPSKQLESSYSAYETEREGFEPSNEVSPVTRFPVAPVQPLRHLSLV